MSVGVPEAKAALRSAMRARLRAMSPEDRRYGSAAIVERLEGAARFRGCRCVLGFVPLPSEPDLWPALERARSRGVEVAVPRWDEAGGDYLAVSAPASGSWVVGPHGAQEPGPFAQVVPFERLDLVLVPGLAFDRSGRRLGRGRGFFDRMLARAGHALKWGVGWDLQVVDAVPSEAHDMDLDVLVTPGSWVAVTARV